MKAKVLNCHGALEAVDKINVEEGMLDIEPLCQCINCFVMSSVHKFAPWASIVESASINRSNYITISMRDIVADCNCCNS